MKETESLGVPHVDYNNYAGVIYFNDDEECIGGTSFYKHKSSNKELLDDKKEYKYLLKGNVNEIVSDTDDTWELLYLVPMKFNRAIFYPSRIFHSAYIKDNYFTDNYRITQTLFF